MTQPEELSLSDLYAVITYSEKYLPTLERCLQQSIEDQDEGCIMYDRNEIRDFEYAKCRATEIFEDKVKKIFNRST